MDYSKMRAIVIGVHTDPDSTVEVVASIYTDEAVTIRKRYNNLLAALIGATNLLQKIVDKRNKLK